MRLVDWGGVILKGCGNYEIVTGDNALQDEIGDYLLCRYRTR